jgi:hypothetical protein
MPITPGICHGAPWNTAGSKIKSSFITPIIVSLVLESPSFLMITVPHSGFNIHSLSLVADDEVVLPERQHNIHLAIVRLLGIIRHRLPQCDRGPVLGSFG